MRRHLRISVIVLALVSPAGYGYETSTDQFMTLVAATNSILNTDPSLLGELGLPALTDGAPFYSVNGQGGNALYVLGQGAILEDSGGRSRNHFFDPQFQGFVGRGWQSSLGTGLKSPDWALFDPGSDPGASANTMSYRSAETYFYAALTRFQSSDANQQLRTGIPVSWTGCPSHSGHGSAATHPQ